MFATIRTILGWIFQGEQDGRTSRSTPTSNDLKQLVAWVERNQRMPETDEDFKSISSKWYEFVIRSKDDVWRNEMIAHAEKVLKEDPELAEKVLNEIDEDVPGIKDFFWNEAKLHVEGTKEHDLYNFFREMGEAQHEIGRTELARGERDMQVEMAQQRQQLIDEVRKRRQNQLRSGLSSAQIANEEVQMLLMGQQAQQDVAQRYFDTRTQMQQQHQMNPFQAELAARGHIREGMQGNSGMYAAFTGDPIATSKAFGEMTPYERYWSQTFLNPDKKD